MLFAKDIEAIFEKFKIVLELEDKINKQTTDQEKLDFFIDKKNRLFKCIADLLNLQVTILIDQNLENILNRLDYLEGIQKDY